MKFSGESFQFPVSVRHQGIVFVLAVKSKEKEIGYRVLDRG